MIQYIRNIGQYIQQSNQSKSVIAAMVNRINIQDMQYILQVNITDEKITYDTIDFYEDVVIDALFSQAGRFVTGGGVRLDYYEQTDAKGIYKGRKKLKSACSFCEVEQYYDAIEEHVEQYLEEHDKKAFLIILLDGKAPKDLYKKKFLDTMYSTMYKGLEGKHYCHLCGKKGKVYNTTTYKFYTNDKEIYGNLNDSQKSGVVIGQDCLEQIILAKEYIETYLSAYWLGQKVMFLPHVYNEDIGNLYELSELNEEGKIITFLTKLRLNEREVIDEIGKRNATTDIIFYEDDSKYFYINHSIQSILPTRFSLISSLLIKYELKLFSILKYAAAVKISLDEVETTKKEQMKVLESIFTGRKLDRNLFFKRVMDVYRLYARKDEIQKYYPMKTINRIYNFLCDCGCLEKGWNVLSTYSSYEELFKDNTEYFDTNEKRAWFVLGKAYNTMVYFIKTKQNRNEENVDAQERTSLEKNFFFARKFDFNDFIYFANLLTEKAQKYNVNTPYFQSMMCEAKEQMARKENKLSSDEAKYLFFWGMDSYFPKEDKKDIKGAEENGKN